MWRESFGENFQPYSIQSQQLYTTLTALVSFHQVPFTAGWVAEGKFGIRCLPDRSDNDALWELNPKSFDFVHLAKYSTVIVV